MIRSLEHQPGVVEEVVAGVLELLGEAVRPAGPAALTRSYAARLSSSSPAMKSRTSETRRSDWWRNFAIS